MAVVVPDVDVIKCWAQENGIPGTFSVLCNNPEVKQLIMDDMLAWGKEMGLKSFEQVWRLAKFFRVTLFCVLVVFRWKTFICTRTPSVSKTAFWPRRWSRRGHSCAAISNRNWRTCTRICRRADRFVFRGCIYHIREGSDKELPVC